MHTCEYEQCTVGFVLSPPFLFTYVVFVLFYCIFKFIFSLVIYIYLFVWLFCLGQGLIDMDSAEFGAGVLSPSHCM